MMALASPPVCRAQGRPSRTLVRRKLDAVTHAPHDALLRGRTSFVIAHRLSTVRNANLIVVLEQGRLVESGTHDELMRRQGLYYYLSSQQLGTS